MADNEMNKFVDVQTSENIVPTETTDVKTSGSKFYETLFLGTIAGIGLMFGFSNGIAAAKKNDENAFNKGLMMLPEKPELKPMESGARLATRALGIGTVYAFAGVGFITALIWFSVGAKDFQEFRQKVGQKLPKVPRNDPPLSRTEFESFREFFEYLAEESEKSKKLKQQQQQQKSKE
ncbi:Transmembrane protein [Sarcoptes scabiei]|uniref:Transmembrane protein 242 n=2 Tax=Sarcoptes scabiei TaxID=52283 RepID=A0A834VC32_SARSC|nr:Transmembrane protein [Sarcoptes scabiei]